MQLKRIASIFGLISLLMTSSQQMQGMSFIRPFFSNVKDAIENHPIITIACTGLLGTFAFNQINTWYKNSLYWNWDENTHESINDQPIDQFFKERRLSLAANGSQWLWGVATSAHQVEGNCTNNNWYEWSQLKKQKDDGIVDAGKACDHWNRYKEDIQLIKELGVNAYRFSVEWSKVMPAPGVVDESALDHYEDVCKELVSNGINPVITLFHYTEPLWFYHKERKVLVDKKHFSHLQSLLPKGEKELVLTGWEDPENIAHFVQFCQVVFARLHKYVHLWLTFNSPEGHALQGWWQMNKPPAKKSMPLAVEVLKNLMEAHVAVYQTLKKMDGGFQAKIGILKNIFQLDPWRACHPLDQLACKIGNALQNDSIYNFLKTGKFYVNVPGKASLSHTNEYLAKGGKSLDFIGLNYYCHGYMKNFSTIRDDKNEIPTNNDKYTIYPEGLYRAICEISEQVAKPFNIPIYITENGIGTDFDAHRILFSQRYLYALAKAIDQGHDVRGYILWSLMDNYEWGYYKKQYGLYHVNFDTQERTLKDGARYYVGLINKSI